MRKSIEELQKLNSKNLLRYYRAERKRYNVAISTYLWGFDRIDYMWDHSDETSIFFVGFPRFWLYIDDVIKRKKNDTNNSNTVFFNR
jgi:hypothetical protein